MEEEKKGCSVCQKTPAKVCECNGEKFCDKHLAKHLKTEGEHNVIAPEEVKVGFHERSASLSEKKSSEKGRRAHTADKKRVRKQSVEEDPPAAPVRKEMTKPDFIVVLQAEIGKVQRFRDTTTDAIANMAEALITQIVSESKTLIRDIMRICAETEEPLGVALQILQGLPAEVTEIPKTNPVLVRLWEARKQEGYEMLQFMSEIRELTIDFKSNVKFSVEWAPVASMVDIRNYFDANKSAMHPNLQGLFDTILAEKHYTTETLSLSKSSLSENGGVTHLAKVLPYFSQVKELKMGGNSLGVDEARILFPEVGKMVSITKLHLQKNDLKAAGARELSMILGNFTKLRDLDLSGNSLGAEGIRLIAEKMKRLPNLKQLHLQDNNLGSESAKHLAGGLRLLKGLKNLYLDGNNFASEDIRTINNSNASGCKIQFNKSP